MKTVDATIARRQLGTLLDKVYYKRESIVIERKGKPMAKIVPLDTPGENKEKLLTPIQKKLLEELNSLPILEINEEPTEVLRRIREKRAEKVKDHYGSGE